jgi:hypothetical protein
VGFKKTDGQEGYLIQFTDVFRHGTQGVHKPAIDFIPAILKPEHVQCGKDEVGIVKFQPRIGKLIRIENVFQAGTVIFGKLKRKRHAEFSVLHHQCNFVDSLQQRYTQVSTSAHS